MKLFETFGTRVQLVEGTGQDSITISAPFAVGDLKNRNGRTYPSALLEREISRLQKMIRAGESIYSGAGHPEGKAQIEVPQVSHIIRELWWNQEEKTAYLNADLLPTESGKAVAVILKNNGSLFLSMRGLGNINKAGTVQEGFQLLGCDIVLSGGFQQATFNKSNIVGESFEVNPEKVDSLYESIMKDKVKVITEKIMKDIKGSAILTERKQRERYSQARISGYTKDFKTYQDDILKLNPLTDNDKIRFKNAKIAGFKGDMQTFKTKVLKK
jgi:hypothetical protein